MHIVYEIIYMHSEDKLFMKRTTIFVGEELLNSLKHIANEEGISVAEAIRQALYRFVAQRQRPRKRLSIIGIGRSGRKDISERCEELLWTSP
ncbi:MAG: ribbon-helix-helix domain-containing protein [Thermodesulfobacteriota bacterium]